jgi:hypothetical protein
MAVMHYYDAGEWKVPYFLYPKMWNGSEWVYVKPSVWNGDQWVTLVSTSTSIPFDFSFGPGFIAPQLFPGVAIS